MKPSSPMLRELCLATIQFSKTFLLIFLVSSNVAAQDLALDVQLDNRRPRLTWNGNTGAVYHVMSRDSLRTGDWQRIATVVPEALRGEWVDSDPATLSRFYRLVQGDQGMRAQ